MTEQHQEERVDLAVRLTEAQRRAVEAATETLDAIADQLIDRLRELRSSRERRAFRLLASVPDPETARADPAAPSLT